MTAGAQLQECLVRLTGTVDDLSGVFDGPPARAAFPYLVVDCGTERDWSCQSHVGREVTAELTLWDDQPGRLQALEATLEMAIRDPEHLADWRIMSFGLQGKKKARDPSGPWSCSLLFLARLLRSSEAGE